MKNILFILDRAHGSNVSGKRSPDSSFIEWEYSEKTIQTLAKELDKLNIPYAFTVNNEFEPGLFARVTIANKLSKGVKTPILLSFHNNAGGGTGIELFTTVNEDESDKIAHIIGNRFIKDFKNVHYRKCEKGSGNLDKERDFTILAGNKHVKPLYHAVLTEFLFMDNTKDLLLLKSEVVFKKYIDTLLYAIFEIYQRYTSNNYLPEVTVSKKPRQ